MRRLPTDATNQNNEEMLEIALEPKKLVTAVSDSQARASASCPAIDTKPVLTEAEARAAFAARGINIAEWARARGFSPELTRMVLSGKRKCLRGQSHQIAVALGIKLEAHASMATED